MDLASLSWQLTILQYKILFLLDSMNPTRNVIEKEREINSRSEKRAMEKGGGERGGHGKTNPSADKRATNQHSLTHLRAPIYFSYLANVFVWP